MTAELESIHSSITRANSTANLPFFLTFFYAAAAAAGAQSPNLVYTPHPRLALSCIFPRSLLTTSQHARDVNVCRKKGFVCVLSCGVAGWACTVYTAVPHQHQSSMDSYRHRTPPLSFTTPPLLLSGARLI